MIPKALLPPKRIRGSEVSEELSLLGHLGELRKRILMALWGFGTVLVPCSLFVKKIAETVFLPYHEYLPEGSGALAYTGISDIFFVYMKMAAVSAVFLSSPWLFYQLWLFLKPALREKERKLAVPFVLGTAFFMMAGMAFSYFLVLPLTFRFFFSLNEGYRNVVTASGIWNFELLMIIGIGLCFETPVLIFLLARLRLVTPGKLLKGSKWAVLISFIAAAVITPSGDPFTQAVVALPMIVLYYLGFLLAIMFPAGKEEPS